MNVTSHRGLKQTTTFRPFPREFVCFSCIAGRASQYQITDVIGRNVSPYYATERKCMLNVIDVFTANLLKLRETTCGVVATILLLFQLMGYLLRSVCALYGSCTGAAVMRIYPMPLPYFRTLGVFLTIDLHLFMYIRTLGIFSRPCLFVLSYFRTAFVCAHTLLLLRTLLIDSHSLFYFRTLLILFSVVFCVLLHFRLEAVFSSCGILALLTLLVEAISLTLVSLKKFISSREFFVALNTLFTSICGVFRTHRYSSLLYRASTFFATRSHPALRAFLSMEVLSGSRKGLFTGSALLLRNGIRYSISHDKVNPLSSRRGMFQHRHDSTLLPLHYTTNPPVKQVQGVFA